MSKDPKFSRRRALASATGLGASLVGVSGTAVGEPDKDQEQKREEIIEAIQQSETLVTTRDFDIVEGELQASQTPTEGVPSSMLAEDADIYIGKYKNASYPEGDPIVFESIEEWRQRGKANELKRVAANNVGTNDLGSESLYLEKLFNPGKVAGYDIRFGTGVGITITADTTGELSATFAWNLVFEVGGSSWTISPTTFSIGAEVVDDSFCIGPIEAGSTPIKVRVCGTAQINKIGGGTAEVEVGLAPEFCVSKVFTFCPIELSGTLKGEVPLPGT